MATHTWNSFGLWFVAHRSQNAGNVWQQKEARRITQGFGHWWQGLYYCSTSTGLKLILT